jgi:hypothetical protein
MTIGRHADNHIVLDDPMVSRHHARLTRQGETFLLEDMGSANGVWLNNVRLTGPAALRPGDVIGLGKEILLAFSDRPQADHTMYDASARAAAAPVAVRPASLPVVVPPAAAAVPPVAGAGRGWLAFGMGGLLAVLAVVGLAIAGLAVYLFLLKPPQPTEPPQTPQAQAALPTPTPQPTATPYPTYTPVPTEPPTQTPYPTYTPFPTAAPTATPYPTYTPFPTAAPTATPYPTYTPYPTFTPRPAAPANPPTATPPPPTPGAVEAAAPYDIVLGRNVSYEPWGRPTDPGGCQGPYDDESPVRRLTVEVLLTNNSNQFVTFDTPIFVSALGAPLPSCYWAYNPDDPHLEVVRPGETKNVTFGTHLEANDYVQALVWELPGWTVSICLNGAGHQIPCR